VATLVELVRGGALRMRGVTSWAPVHDGEVLDVPGRPGVVHVPGHTRGSVAFVLPDRDVCFTGDALVTWDLLTGRRGPRLLGRGFTEDSTAALASLDRLTALPTTVLLPGHGEPWHGAMGDAVDRARAAGPS
jgi:glyoxylase-like metal-dependent hydrolase (beta-lactamase superfamily II)